MSKVVILSSVSRSLPGWDEAIGYLQDQGVEVADEGEGPFDDAQTVAALGAADAALVGTNPITGEHIARAGDRLRIIAKPGIGVDNIDVDAAGRRGIVVCNTPGSNAVTVAEHAFSLLLTLTRHTKELDHLTREGQGWNPWPPLVGDELYGKTMGVVGLGHIGREMASRAHAFGMRVIGHDVAPAAYTDQGTVRLVRLDELLSAAHVVSVHVPLVEGETRGLIGRAALSAMQRGSYLLNTSRGGVVDEVALVAALREGRLAGAGIDVFAEEPMSTANALMSLPNVVLTPHVAGFSPEASARARITSAHQIVDMVSGKQVSGVVNRSSMTSGPRSGETPEG